jgi:VanZ family protein
MLKTRYAPRNSPRALDVITIWGPALLWMALIFYLSSQNTWTSVKGPPWFNALRKSGHIIEYSVLALLLGRALLGTWTLKGEAITRALLARIWQIGVLLATIYALTDEVHQSFVPRREFHLTDILIDGLSATAALGIWYIVRARKRERQPVTLEPK